MEKYLVSNGKASSRENIDLDRPDMFKVTFSSIS